MSDRAELVERLRRGFGVHQLEMTAAADMLEADEIAIYGGCACPAPYDQCPHDEPLLPALNNARTENAAFRAQLDEVKEWCRERIAEADAILAPLVGTSKDMEAWFHWFARKDAFVDMLDRLADSVSPPTTQRSTDMGDELRALAAKWQDEIRHPTRSNPDGRTYT